MNLRAIQEVINSQTLQYIFPFSMFSFPTDVAFTVLSEGKKSTFFQVSSNHFLRESGPTDIGSRRHISTYPYDLLVQMTKRLSTEMQMSYQPHRKKNLMHFAH
jgi:hypothetical protein